MGWYLVDNIGDRNSCGNLLVSIAQNHKQNKQKQNTVFAKQSAIANNFLNIQNADLIASTFNYNVNNKFNTSSIPSEYSLFFNFANMNGLNSELDLIGASLFNPYKTNKTVSHSTQTSNTRVTQNEKKQNKVESTSYLGNLWNNIKNTIKEVPQKVTTFLGGVVDFAMSFIGKINNDRDGNRVFSPNGKSQAWCADFVTYCVRKIFGNKIPSDFGSSAVSGLLSWGEQHNCYSIVPQSKSVNAMRNFIKNNVKPGDIMIQKDNGRSHTGIVKSVAADGSSYVVVEGNSSDRVQTVTYHVNNPSDPGIKYISGFISLEQFA